VENWGCSIQGDRRRKVVEGSLAVVGSIAAEGSVAGTQAAAAGTGAAAAAAAGTQAVAAAEGAAADKEVAAVEDIRRMAVEGSVEDTLDFVESIPAVAAADKGCMVGFDCTVVDLIVGLVGILIVGFAGKDQVVPAVGRLVVGIAAVDRTD